MGGCDKPLIVHDGKAMVEWVVDSGPSSAPVLISANRNLDEYARFGETFTDEEVDLPQEVASPLVGVLGGLQRCSTEALMVAPGDTPFLQPRWWEALINADRGQGAVIHDGQRQQHLHLLLHKDQIGSLTDYLSQGNRAAWAWLEQVGIATAPSPNPDWYKNVNYRTDLD